MPNFGLDHDIATSQANEQATESKLNHQWVPKWDEEKEKFEVPSPDIEFKLIGLNHASDPICSSAGCPTKKDKSHPKDYPVPDFGVDPDIISTQKHIADQEKLKNHKWVPITEDPAKENKLQISERRPSDRRAVQLKTDVQIESKEQQKAEFANLKSAMKSNWGTK